MNNRSPLKQLASENAGRPASTVTGRHSVKLFDAFQSRGQTVFGSMDERWAQSDYGNDK